MPGLTFLIPYPVVFLLAQYQADLSLGDVSKHPMRAIDTEYKVDYENKSKPHTVYAVSVVNSEGGIQAKHTTDFQNHPQPEKGLVKWFIREILKVQTHSRMVQQGC